MPTPSDKHAEIAPEQAAAALAALIRGARAARTRADGLQAVLDHAAVELMLWQEGFRPGAEGRDTRRAELFDLGSARDVLAPGDWGRSLRRGSRGTERR
jgi:hypothetical protein